MPFPTEPGVSLTPAAIGRIVIVLRDDDGSQPGKKVRFQVEVLSQLGTVMATREGDLQPHLSGAQLSGLSDFLDAMRVKAAAEILPH